jgi:3-isopropylmalate/(R)-2-methylmalate dehydratase small subunit
MEKFTNIKSHIISLALNNVDTDMIIPKQFLKTIKRTGLGEYLFYEMRFDEDGTKIEDSIFNQEIGKTTKILISGNNFGCGSSREHAPWSLADYGIKVIIAPSYADIFYNNCFKNGILPIILEEEKSEDLKKTANKLDNKIEIDLKKQQIIIAEDKVINFEMDKTRKNHLLEGLDDIELSLKSISEINKFETEQKSKLPWLYQNEDSK